MFKIKIENFKCYEGKHKFKFELEKTHLFRGRSGIGKSTLFEAASHCFYGKATNIQPNMKPNSVTKIEIKYKNLIIFRQNKSTIFYVICDGEKYGKEAGAAIIEEYFGSVEIWKTSSYLKQKSDNGILNVTASKKMEILNKFTFSSDDPRYYIKELNSNINNLRTKYNYRKEYFDEEFESFEKTCFDNNIEDFNELKKETKISDFQEKKKMLEKNLKKIKKDKNRYNEQKNKIKIYSKILEDSENELGSIDEITKDEIEKYRQNLKILDTNNDIQQIIMENEDLLLRINKKIENNQRLFLESSLRTIENNQRLFLESSSMIYEREEIYLTRKEIEELEINKKIYEKNKKNYEKNKRVYEKNLNICERLNIEYNEIMINKEIENLEINLSYIDEFKKIEKFDNMKNKLEKISFFNRDIYTGEYLYQLRENLKILNDSKNIKICPCCNANLKVIKGNLVEANIDVLFDIDEKNRLEDEIDKCKNELKKEKEYEMLSISISKIDIVDIPEDIEKVNKQKTTKTIRDLRNISFMVLDDELFAKPKEDIDFLKYCCGKKEIEQLIEENKKLLVPIEGRYTESELNKMKNKREKIKILKNKVKENKNKLQDTSENLPEKVDDNEIKSLEKKISKLTEKIFFSKTLTIIREKYFSLKEKKKEVKKLEKKIKIYESIRDKAIFKETERLDNLINTLNSFINSLCLELFIDPIKIILQLEKDLKGGGKKTGANLMILYKGGTYDGVKNISGGERERINLILTLAFNSVSSSDILIFDESFASLDFQTKEKCNEVIKRYCHDKTIFMVNHEGSTGIYDNTVSF